MGGGQSSCACDDGLLSLASRCTNPPTSSVYNDDDVDDDDGDNNEVAVENRDTPRCSILLDTSDEDTNVEHVLKSSSNTSVRNDIAALQRGENSNTSELNKSSKGRSLASLLPFAGICSEFDLNRLHPLDPPFLGDDGEEESILPAVDVDEDAKADLKDDASSSMQRYQIYRAALPSLFSDTTSKCSPARLNNNRTPSDHGTPDSLKSILTTTTASSDEDDVGEDDQLDDFHTPLPVKFADGHLDSRDLAIASDKLVSAVNAGTRGTSRVVPARQVTPKRLFQGGNFIEDADDAESNISPISTPGRASRRLVDPPATPERIISSKPLCSIAVNKPCAGTFSPDRGNRPLIYNGVLINGIPESPARGHYGSCEQPSGMNSSLPSKLSGQPIRLRITDIYAGGSSNSLEADDWTISSSDFFSFRTPFFSASEYAVTTPSNRPWGGGMTVKMDDPNRMQVVDCHGNVVAIMRNRNTFIPSHIIYGTRPRYPGQRPCSHRGEIKGIGSNDVSFETIASGNIDEDIVRVYPWALVKKDGRRMTDSVSIHMAVPNSLSESSADTPMDKDMMKGFSSRPSFRSKHGYDGHGGHSHTVVSRILEPHESACRPTNTEENDMPCCLIFRNPVKEGVYDATIAPGIDPVLIICYLTLHARMDAEPGLSHH